MLSFLLFPDQARTKGFSLLELLVCVAIVGILSSICVVSYHGAMDMADIKGSLPIIIGHLNGYQKTAREEKLIITVEFLEGTSKIRVTTQGEEEEDNGSGEYDFNMQGLLKRKLVFRKYKWPDGAASPPTFTYYPDAAPVGGKVFFGTGFAEVSFWLQGDRVVSDI